MKELLVALTMLGNYTVTSYRSVPEQTDSSPFITSIGEKVNKSGVAVSQDLLKSGKIHYGDILYIQGVGLKVVNDTMHPRMKNHLDVWVRTYKDEKQFGTKQCYVFLVKEIRNEKQQKNQAVRGR